MAITLRAMPMMPAFRVAVSSVGGIGSEKQMVRAYTRGRVAMVADVQAARNRPVLKLIGNSVGQCSYPVAIEHAISGAVLRRSPQPAAIGFIDLRPEPLRQEKLWHGSRGVRAGATTEQPPSLVDFRWFRMETRAAVLASAVTDPPVASTTTEQPTTCPNARWNNLKRRAAVLTRSSNPVSFHTKALISRTDGGDNG